MRLELTAADPAALLSKLLKTDVELSDVGQISGLAVQLTIQRSQFSKVQAVCRAEGATWKVLRSTGLLRLLRQALGRPVLVLGFVAILLLTLYVPTKVLFIQVEGAGDIPENKIIMHLENCGIRLGADRTEIRSERVKNALLEAMPELQWVGVNTYGCRAVVSVRPRTQAEREVPERGISSIVAARDGVIRQFTTLQGNTLCKIGQSVTQGQVLISGYSDLGICLRGTQAKGEVYAQTQHALQVLTPSEINQRGEVARQEKKYSVIIGKFRINFFKGSGISDATCVKMYSYNYMTLPGGFQLPIALVAEQTVWHGTNIVKQNPQVAGELLSACADRVLLQSMIAGQIENRYEIVTELDGVYYQVGKYACYEMIGISRPEEDLTKHEVN